MSIPLLLTLDMAADHVGLIQNAGFTVHQAVGPARRAAVIAAQAGSIRAVLTNGTTGFTAAEIGALPLLQIICALGAGYEGIDLPAARARGISVTHGPGVNDSAVADHAMALLLAAVRRIPQLDAAVRRGEWGGARQMQPSICGRKLGVLGLGNIGRKIAQRASAGFEMAVAYHNRTELADVPYAYCPDAKALAAWCDFLVVATPGGAGTRNLVDAAVLTALGPAGFLVNIARGSVVDTDALVDALEHGGIAGAGLDVVAGEPNVPAELLRQTAVVFTPHVAGRTPEAVRGTVELVIANLLAHFGSMPVLTPAPG